MRRTKGRRSFNRKGNGDAMPRGLLLIPTGNGGKAMKKVYLVLAILAIAILGVKAFGRTGVALVPARPGSGASDLLLYLHPEKERYKLGEQVFVDAELYNEGEETQRLNVVLAPPGRILRLVIENPSGVITDRSNILVAREDQPDDYLSLAPGLYVGMRIDLAHFYTIESPGRYKIKGVYLNSKSGDRFGSPAWQGRLESNAIEIHVD
jgi:hypothetical protein